jgi:hypothetical protein
MNPVPGRERRDALPAISDIAHGATRNKPVKFAFAMVAPFIDGITFIEASEVRMQTPDRAGHFSIRAAVTAVLVGIPAVASASGFALLEQSASRLGTAFAGTAAAADDASTVFYNPAGLTLLAEKQPQMQVLVVASGIDIGSTFSNRNSQAALGQPLGGNGGDAGGWNAVPAAYLALPINSDLAFGLGLNAPF